MNSTGAKPYLTLLTVFVAAFAAYEFCVVEWFLLPEKRAFNALKNRIVLPGPEDFDPAATLEALLQPGDDRVRWSQQRAAAVEGYVVRIIDARPESANCFSLTRVDAHVELAVRPDAPAAERLVAEVTPPMREWATRQGRDWSTTTLQRTLVGQRVRIEGWLLFDDEHDEDAENTSPGRRGNWRATAWEVHPITNIEIR